MKSIPGSNTLLVGATGSGKTHSIRSVVGTGVTPFILFTEPGMRTVSDLKCPDLHYMYVTPAKVTWDEMFDSAKKINTLSFKALTQLPDINKGKYGQFMNVVTAMNNFTCDRCGESFGDVSTWGTDRMLVVDSMSGLNIMAMDLVAGSKPVKAVGDWGVAMDNLERFINGLTTNTQCHFVLIAHLERVKDEISGGIQLMTATLGNKLAPKIPRFFDDVVLCHNREGVFSWATAGINVDLKWRNLAGSKDLPPSFAPLIDSWKNAGGIIESGEADDLAKA